MAKFKKDLFERFTDYMAEQTSVDMDSLQSGSVVACSLSFLHECGNLACVAGHLALWPEFKEAGGKVNFYHGAPALDGALGSEAFSSFFGVNYDLASSLVNGYGQFRQIYNPEKGKDVPWSDWTAAEAVLALKKLAELQEELP